MATSFDIQPAPDEARTDALCVLLAGRAGRPSLAAQATAFDARIARRALHVELWWALHRGKPVAAAMAAENPGRSALLFYSPLDASGVRVDAAAQVVDVVSKRILARHVAFVQAITARDVRRDARMLQQVGYEKLADLDTMQLDLPAPPAAPLPITEHLRWRPVAECPPEHLESVLDATYARSLDCPKLSGLRTPAETIAAHRSTGTLTPASWWIVDCDDQPAGVCLVNDVTDTRASTVVYLGVTRSFRGRSIGRAMLRHVAGVAEQRGQVALTLAVDILNTYAWNAYVNEGFRPTDSRSAYIYRPKRSSDAASE